MSRIVEQAVADVCGLPRPGLWFCVDEVATLGHPPERLKIWATLHFFPKDSPFCCGEPGCHLGLNDEIIRQQVDQQVRRAMHLRQAVSVEFDDRIAVHYHPGITFDHGETDSD